MRYLTLLLIFCASVSAADPTETFEYVGSLASMLSEAEARDLGQILPADQQIRWKLFVPNESERNGVLVFSHPNASAEPPEGWARVLRDQKLIWIAAEGFGNEAPSAQRVLVALVGLAHVRHTYSLDERRIYIAGMSGGGRVASRVITKFPRLFTGAIYIVGADHWTRDEEPLRELIVANRYVFLTGHQDFNRSDVKRVHRRYRAAGANATLLLDLPRFGHEYPAPEVLERAVRFLDSGSDGAIE